MSSFIVWCNLRFKMNEIYLWLFGFLFLQFSDDIALIFDLLQKITLRLGIHDFHYSNCKCSTKNDAKWCLKGLNLLQNALISLWRTFNLKRFPTSLFHLHVFYYESGSARFKASFTLVKKIQIGSLIKIRLLIKRYSNSLQCCKTYVFRESYKKQTW